MVMTSAENAVWQAPSAEKQVPGRTSTPPHWALLSSPSHSVTPTAGAEQGCDHLENNSLPAPLDLTLSLDLTPPPLLPPPQLEL